MSAAMGEFKECAVYLDDIFRTPAGLRRAKRLLAGLNARIDRAPMNAKPVFRGIDELHAAIYKAEDS